MTVQDVPQNSLTTFLRIPAAVVADASELAVAVAVAVRAPSETATDDAVALTHVALLLACTTTGAA